jgi:hypothetical protein
VSATSSRFSTSLSPRYRATSPTCAALESLQLAAKASGCTTRSSCRRTSAQRRFSARPLLLFAKKKSCRLTEVVSQRYVALSKKALLSKVHHSLRRRTIPAAKPSDGFRVLGQRHSLKHQVRILPAQHFAEPLATQGSRRKCHPKRSPEGDVEGPAVCQNIARFQDKQSGSRQK